MILQIYSVYDKAVRAFLPPFFARAEGEALRMFSQAVNTAGDRFNEHAADFMLFKVGVFDDSAGRLETDDTMPVRVIGALEVLRPVVRQSDLLADLEQPAEETARQLEAERQRLRDQANGR